MATKFSKPSTPVTYIPIGGTDSWDEDENNYQWWERGSEFNRFMATQNLILHARTPFEWSTCLDGVPFLPGISKRNNHIIWKSAAKHLICFLERVPLEERNIVAHSHGGNVTFYALSYGLQINNLITVGTPVRSDMEAVVLKGLGNCAYWHHIYDSSKDMTSVLGALFDGKIRVRHNFDLADTSDNVKGIGHSAILNDYKFISLWSHDQKGWASILASGKGAFNGGTTR
jgi:pimeloyl-ACP methyl ester carboxylesterase